MSNSEHYQSVTEAAVNAVMKQLEINHERQGEEFYRRPYDQALHIVTAIRASGLKIVEPMLPSARTVRLNHQEQELAQLEKEFSDLLRRLSDLPKLPLPKNEFQAMPLPEKLRRSVVE